jgi:hypothetical protein
MTKDKEQAFRLLVNRHAQTVQRSLFDHLKRVIPIPALDRALKSWPRKKEWDSLEATVAKIMDVMHEPVIVTRPIGVDGTWLKLVSLYEAGPMIGVSGRTLYDLSISHAHFPAPFVVTTVGKLWIADDILSFSRVYRPDGGWKVTRQSGPKKEKEKET